MSANRDGSNERQHHRSRRDVMGALSSIRPATTSIFATSVHGFANFELYIVDTDGEREPVRVTAESRASTACLCSLQTATGRLPGPRPRTADKQAQIFMADWNDADREANFLDLEEKTAIVVVPGEVPPLPESTAEISPDDLRLHVEALASEAMEGRLTGSQRRASSPPTYIAEGVRTSSVLSQLAMMVAISSPLNSQPVFLSAPRISFRSRSPDLEATPLIDRDWRPLGMSTKEGNIEAGAEITFAGYGVVASSDANQGKRL